MPRGARSPRLLFRVCNLPQRRETGISEHRSRSAAERAKTGHSATAQGSYSGLDSDDSRAPEDRGLTREIFDAARVLAGAQRDGELAMDAERLVGELDGVRAGGQREAEQRGLAARSAVDADVSPRRGVDVERGGRFVPVRRWRRARLDVARRS